MNVVTFTQMGLFILLAGFLLHQMKPVLLPLVLAIIVSMVLHPVYLIFRKLKLPCLLASLITVSGLISLLGFGAYQVAGPGAEWTRSIDQQQIAERLKEVFRPVGEVRAEIEQVANQVEKATTVEIATASVESDPPPNADTDEKTAADITDEVEVETSVTSTQKTTFENRDLAAQAIASSGVGVDAAKDMVETPDQVVASETTTTTAGLQPDPVVVQIREDPLDSIIEDVQSFGIGVGAFLFLVLFILAYGNRIVRSLNQEEGTANILDRMGNDVSRYLFAITLINAGLGVCIGLAMWILGLPNPMLWGLMAFILNFIPYVGALVGTGVVFLAAAVQFEDPGRVILVPVVYFLCTAIEGNFVTPVVLGGRFRLNPLIVFVWVFLWAGFWGIAGMLIAMPALVIFKIVCENIATMEKFRRILSA